MQQPGSNSPLGCGDVGDVRGFFLLLLFNIKQENNICRKP
jgi:hypothetical protein